MPSNFVELFIPIMSQDIQMFEIEATVVSGLEEVARDEVEEVLKAQIYEVKQGRVNFLLHNMREVHFEVAIFSFQFHHFGMSKMYHLF